MKRWTGRVLLNNEERTGRKRTTKISRLNCCNMNSHFFNSGRSGSGVPAAGQAGNSNDESDGVISWILRTG